MTEAPAQAAFRDAVKEDVPSVVALLADDSLGQAREASGADVNPAYWAAFEAIGRDPNNRLIVAVLEGEVIGCMQLTTIPHLTFTGGIRLQIEGVRIKEAFRSQRIGADMIEWAIAYGRSQACHVVQLTSNQSRKDALRFYEKLGFEPSHVGFKRYLT
jgi:ribosomal protein S18 acetylase RimI-like enzyme